MRNANAPNQWDSGDMKSYYIQACWPTRNLDSSKSSMLPESLFDTKDVLLPLVNIMFLAKKSTKDKNKKGKKRGKER